MICGTLENGMGDGVFAGALEACGQLQELIFRPWRQRLDLSESRATERQGAGLVHDQSVNVSQGFDGSGVT